MIKKRTDERELKTLNMATINNLALGYDDENFIIAFNKNDDEVFEMSYTIEATSLKELIMMFFEAGIHYEEETGKDIGFNIGEYDE